MSGSARAVLTDGRQRFRELLGTPFALVLAAFLALRLVSVIGVDVTRVPDSQSWLELNFSGSEIRLWTVPLLFKVLPNDTLRELGHAGMSVVCWVALAGLAAFVMERRVMKVIAFAIILALALVTQVTNWDTVILGESFAISITIGTFAAWWWFVLRPSTASTVVVCVATVLWAFLRHVDVVLTALILVAVLVSIVRNRDRLRIAVAAVLVVILAWGVPTFSKNPFNEEEVLTTLLSERILPYPDRVEWFADHGMPATPDVVKLANSWTLLGKGSGPIRDNKKLFRWMQRDGRSTYFQYLATHPGYLLFEPVTQAIRPTRGEGAAKGGLKESTILSSAQYGEIRPVVPRTVEDLLFGGPGTLVGLTVVTAVLAAFAFGRRRWTRRELVPGLAVLVSAAMYWATFHGVATEPERHYVVAAVSIRATLLVLALLAVDRLVRPQEPPAKPSTKPATKRSVKKSAPARG